jgi:hypothetical protein
LARLSERQQAHYIRIASAPCALSMPAKTAKGWAAHGGFDTRPPRGAQAALFVGPHGLDFADLKSGGYLRAVLCLRQAV